MTAGGAPSWARTISHAKPSAANRSRVASALRSTSPARAGSADTDWMRTRSSRSRRMPGMTSARRAGMSTVMEQSLGRVRRGPVAAPLLHHQLPLDVVEAEATVDLDRLTVGVGDDDESAYAEPLEAVLP